MYATRCYAGPGLLVFVVIATCAAVPVRAQSLVVDVGRGRIGDYMVVSRSNDRASVCDEFINPRAVLVPGCTTPDRGVGDGWVAPFSDGGGLLAGLGVESEIAGPWTLAVDYSRVRAVFDQTVASTDAQGVDFEKLSHELAVGQERLGTVRTHGVHGVLQRSPLRYGRMRPYGGIGLGDAGVAGRLDEWRRGAAVCLGGRWPVRSLRRVDAVPEGPQHLRPGKWQLAPVQAKCSRAGIAAGGTRHRVAGSAAVWLPCFCSGGNTHGKGWLPAGRGGRERPGGGAVGTDAVAASWSW